jgi:hypothetical protein
MTPCSQRTTRRHIPEDDTLHNHRCENLKSYMKKYFAFLVIIRNKNRKVSLPKFVTDRGLHILISPGPPTTVNSAPVPITLYGL